MSATRTAPALGAALLLAGCAALPLAPAAGIAAPAREPRAAGRVDAAEAALSLRPYASRQTDSDDNRVTRTGIDLLLPAGVGLRAEHADIAGGPFESGSADHVALIGRWLPQPGLRVDALAGVTRLRPPEAAAADRATAKLRLRWRASPDAPAADIQLLREPLLATPALLAAPVDLSEARATFDLPLVGPTVARLRAQAGRLDDGLGANTRRGGRAGLVYRAAPTWELQALGAVLAYERAGVGYFAPRRIETVELGTYFERDDLAPLTISADAGLGRLRITRHGEAAEAWQRSFRLWASLAWDLRPGVQLALEIEHDNTLAAGAAATSADWRSTSALVSLRFGVLRRALRSSMRPRG